MYSNEEYLDQTITQFPGPQNYLRRLCEEEKEMTKFKLEEMVEDFEARKEEMVEEAVDLFECESSTLKKSLSKDSKYELQLLKSDDPNYDLLKRSLGLSELKKYSNKNVALRIYRVKSNVERCRCPSLLLLHGTKGKNVEGILKEGLRPSSSGKHGPGIYLTNSFEIAHNYGQNYVEDDGNAKDFTYLFVNKVKKTLASSSGLCGECKDDQSITHKPLFSKKTTSTKFIKSSFLNLDSSLSYEPVLKVFDGNSQSNKQVQLEDFLAREFDSDESTFQVGEDEKKIFVAHHDLVTLEYFIEIEVKQSARELAKHILYCELCKTNFSENLPTSDPPKDTLIENSHVSSEDCSMNTFVAELEKEISANQLAEAEHVKHYFERKVNFFMQQLLFETSSISETNDCDKYKAELLQTSDPDHKFLLESMNKMNPNRHPVILKIFRINSVDGSKNTRGGVLYLRGVKSHEVPNVLARGYPASLGDFLEQCECGPGDCSCYASTDLDCELELGLSHCVTNDQVEKQSFVFVASDGKRADSLAFLNSDTRGCCFKTEMVFSHLPIGLIPVYLVVFSVQ